MNDLREGLRKDLRILLWAAMHHPDFWQCRLILPIDFQFFRSRFSGYPPSVAWHFEIRLKRSFVLYIPWKIERDYQIAVEGAPDYDDIPF